MLDRVVPHAATKDRQNILLHLLLSFYVADILETEDVFGLEQGSQTFKLRHTCFA